MTGSEATLSFSKLNLLRFTAAGMVALFHCGFLFNGHGDLPSYFIIGSDGVFIFFIISGFIIPWSMKQSNYQIRFFLSFLNKRFRRLYPPFFVSLLIYLLGFMIEHEGNIATVLKTGFNHILFLVPFGAGEWINQIYWTLFIELQFYILVGLLFPLLSNVNLSAQYWTILLLNSCTFLTFLIPQWTEKNFIFYHLPYFSIGFIIFLWFSSPKCRVHYLFFFLISLLTLTLNVHYLHKIGWSSIILSIITTIYILFFNTTNKFLEKLGEYSYSFYLFHGLIIAWFIHLLDIPTTLSGKWMYVSGIFICSWMIAAVGYWAIEKKSLLWSKKIKYPYAARITGSK
jgi:peptidoglycan/LPS O-acetylase OafA/YrhL